MCRVFPPTPAQRSRICSPSLGATRWAIIGTPRPGHGSSLPDRGLFP
jgi:hypothetical protein